jgi:hypothetical protein
MHMWQEDERWQQAMVAEETHMFSLTKSNPRADKTCYPSPGILSYLAMLKIFSN